MDTTLGRKGLISPRHGTAHIHRHGLSRGLCCVYAVPAAHVFRGRRRGAAFHPRRGGGACLPAVTLPADQGPGERAGGGTVQPGPRQHHAHRRGRGAAAARPPDPGGRRHRPPRGAGAGPAAPGPGQAGRDAESVHRAAARRAARLPRPAPGDPAAAGGGRLARPRTGAGARRARSRTCGAAAACRVSGAHHGGAAPGGPGRGVGGGGSAAREGRERTDGASGGGTTGDVPARLRPAGTDGGCLPGGGLRAVVHGGGRRDGRGARVRTGRARSGGGAEHGGDAGGQRSADDAVGPAGLRRTIALAHRSDVAPPRAARELQKVLLASRTG